MKFIELNKKLKENIENVYKIIGDDIFLIRQTILNIKKYLVKSFEEFNYVKLDAEKMKVDELESNIMTLPIGNDYRLVVIEKPNNEICNFINKFLLHATNSSLLKFGSVCCILFSICLSLASRCCLSCIL